MGTVQKALFGAALVAAVGTGVYETHQDSQLSRQLSAVRQQQAQLSEQLRAMQQERDDARKAQAALLAENEQLKSGKNAAELLRLRGEVAQLRPLQKNIAVLQKMATQATSGQAEWKPDQVANVGRATPQDAFQTFVWACATTNLAELRNSFVGDKKDGPDQDAIRKYAEDNSTGISNPGVTKFKVLSQTLLSPNEASIQIVEEYDDSGAGVTAPLTMQNVDGEWKLVLFNQRDAEGKVTSLELVNR